MRAYREKRERRMNGQLSEDSQTSIKKRGGGGFFNKNANDR
jgi:hypothetical protein